MPLKEVLDGEDEEEKEEEDGRRGRRGTGINEDMRMCKKCTIDCLMVSFIPSHSTDLYISSCEFEFEFEFEVELLFAFDCVLLWSLGWR